MVVCTVYVVNHTPEHQLIDACKDGLQIHEEPAFPFMSFEGAEGWSDYGQCSLHKQISSIGIEN